jgi:Myb/SANT-like DNA-binding domain
MRKNGRDLKSDQLKNKYNSLRQRWKDFFSLLCETRMGYNGETGQLMASEEI